MSTVAYIAKERRAIAALAEYLGPASVLRLEGSDVVAELPEGAEVRVALAFAFPYAPAEGDVLLVIGKDEAYYAIGVLQGSGESFHPTAERLPRSAEGFQRTAECLPPSASRLARSPSLLSPQRITPKK
jgi:hypothetical protein